ncbi:hypothetical protein AMTRI_Chr09g34900 [Amborella trichopoda]
MPTLSILPTRRITFISLIKQKGHTPFPHLIPLPTPTTLSLSKNHCLSLFLNLISLLLLNQEKQMPIFLVTCTTKWIKLLIIRKYSISERYMTFFQLQISVF